MLFLLAGRLAAWADEAYLCELGVMGGISYYAGDATSHVFMRVRPDAGVQFRYKFTPRWALAVKGQYTEVRFPMPDGGMGQSPVGQVDVVAEYNFFRLRLNGIERFSRSYSPYIFVGIGAALHGNNQHVGPYLPFGLGFKWQIAPRWGLNVDWQQQLFFCDNLEGVSQYDNTYGLNGFNFLRNDFLSTLTLGITFHFAKEPKRCKMCPR